jgi:hypothetical protein
MQSRRAIKVLELIRKIILELRSSGITRECLRIINTKTPPSDPSVVVEDPASGQENSTSNGVACREGSDAAPLVGVIVNSNPGSTCIVRSEESRYAANGSYQVDSR